MPLRGEGCRKCPQDFFKINCLKPIKNHFLKAQTCFAHSLGSLLYIYIVVEVAKNMAEYVIGSQRSEQPKNVNFEPIIRGLKNKDQMIICKKLVYPDEYLQEAGPSR